MQPAGAAPPPSAALASRVAGAPPDARAALVHAHVRRTVTAILGRDEPVDPATPLRDLGLDSLSAIELRNALAVAIGRPLPAVLAFDYPTVDALAAHLLQLLGAAPPEKDGQVAAASDAAARADPMGEDALAAEIASLSEDEAAELLARELADLQATARSGS